MRLFSLNELSYDYENWSNLVGGFCFIVLKMDFFKFKLHQLLHRSGSKIKVEKQKTRNKKAKVGPKFEKLGRVECVFYEPLEKNGPKIWKFVVWLQSAIGCKQQEESKFSTQNLLLHASAFKIHLRLVLCHVLFVCTVWLYVAGFWVVAQRKLISSDVFTTKLKQRWTN